MKYPYFLYDSTVEHRPVFNNLKGPPLVVDMSYKNPIFSTMNVRDQRSYQAVLDREMYPDYQWGVAAYLERRDSLLRDCPQMVEEQRFYHLGMDVIVPLGTKLHAPLAAVVQETGYEEGEGNYGGYVLLRHDSGGHIPFFSFYGHLGRESVPPAETELNPGEPFAEIGDFHENGGWFYHTHIQVITEDGIKRGFISKGYCSAEMLAEINDLCPSPELLFRT